MEDSQWWHVDSAGEVIGPKSVSELKSLFSERKLTAEALICEEGHEAWIPLGDLLEGPTQAFFFDHFARIDDVVEGRVTNEMDELLMAHTSRTPAGGLGFAAGPLHNDDFGNVYADNSPFPAGKLSHPTKAGPLHADSFGTVYSGASHLPVGHTKNIPMHEGDLRVDDFGDVYAGDSHLPIDHITPNDHR